MIAQGDIFVRKIGTKDNLIDMMTKLPSIAKFYLYLDLVALYITWYGGIEEMERDDLMF